jgi:pimeloyl-ACP methyl ester carboxylesterase
MSNGADASATAPPPGTDLHWQAEGQGPAVALAHGFAGSARNFRPQIRALRDRFRVVTFDARGHARSPVEGGAYTLDGFADDFAAVLDAAGARRAVAGGLSMGAAVALRLALRRPERVRALVLASFPAGAGATGGVAANAGAFADAIERDGLDAAGAEFVWGPRSGLGEAEARLVREGFLEHRPEGLVRTLRGVLAELPSVQQLDAELAGLDLPVLVVAGSADAAGMQSARSLARALPRAQFAEISGAGHVVNLAAPERFDMALRRFLEWLG